MVHGLLEDAFVIDDAAAEQSFITVSKRGRTWVVVKLTGMCCT